MKNLAVPPARPPVADVSGGTVRGRCTPPVLHWHRSRPTRTGSRRDPTRTRARSRRDRRSPAIRWAGSSRPPQDFRNWRTSEWPCPCSRRPTPCHSRTGRRRRSSHNIPASCTRASRWRRSNCRPRNHRKGPTPDRDPSGSAAQADRERPPPRRRRSPAARPGWYPSFQGRSGDQARR